MIIGCFNEDGSPAEKVDLGDKRHYFELEVCLVRHPRRYPEYKVAHGGLAFCDNRESAEQMMSKFLHSDEEWLKDIYCFYVYERLLDVPYDRSEYTSCWLYDEHGTMIDKRTFPSYWDENGFEGRSEDEVRFKFGDIAELYDGDNVSLVLVLAPPCGKEHYANLTEHYGEPYRGDISDDTYMILQDNTHYFGDHIHIDALKLFKPHFTIPKNVKKHLDTLWASYQETRRECNDDHSEDNQV